MSMALADPEDAIRAQIRRAREQRALNERRRLKGLMPVPSNLTPAQIKRLAKADRKHQMAVHPADRERTARERQWLLDEFAAETARAEDAKRNNEVVALAQARGEIVVVDGKKGVPGRITLLSHDGLLALHARGAITPRQKEAGLLFRRAHEGSQMRSTPSYGAGQGDAALAMATRRKHDLRRAACLALCHTPKERQALVEVAGEGRTVNCVAGEGNAHVMMVTALRRVLDRVAAKYM